MSVSASGNTSSNNVEIRTHVQNLRLTLQSGQHEAMGTLFQEQIAEFEKTEQDLQQRIEALKTPEPGQRLKAARAAAQETLTLTQSLTQESIEVISRIEKTRKETEEVLKKSLEQGEQLLLLNRIIEELKHT